MIEFIRYISERSKIKNQDLLEKDIYLHKILYEINQIPNGDRKQRILRLCDKSSNIIKLNDSIYEFSEKLKEIGFKSYDALHLACAQMAKVDVFLSTDDKLLKKALQNTNILNMLIDNPLSWLQKIW